MIDISFNYFTTNVIFNSGDKSITSGRKQTSIINTAYASKINNENITNLKKLENVNDIEC